MLSLALGDLRDNHLELIFEEETEMPTKEQHPFHRTRSKSRTSPPLAIQISLGAAHVAVELIL